MVDNQNPVDGTLLPDTLIEVGVSKDVVSTYSDSIIEMAVEEGLSPSDIFQNALLVGFMPNEYSLLDDEGVVFITVDGISVNIHRTIDGVLVRMYPENGDKLLGEMRCSTASADAERGLHTGPFFEDEA